MAGITDIGSLMNYLILASIIIGISLVIGIPIAFLVWYFKSRKIKKNIPTKFKEVKQNDEIQNEEETDLRGRGGGRRDGRGGRIGGRGGRSSQDEGEDDISDREEADRKLRTEVQRTSRESRTSPDKSPPKSRFRIPLSSS